LSLVVLPPPPRRIHSENVQGSDGAKLVIDWDAHDFPADAPTMIIFPVCVCCIVEVFQTCVSLPMTVCVMVLE
jgi:hypothetical protein